MKVGELFKEAIRINKTFQSGRFDSIMKSAREMNRIVSKAYSMNQFSALDTIAVINRLAVPTQIPSVPRLPIPDIPKIEIPSIPQLAIQENSSFGNALQALTQASKVLAMAQASILENIRPAFDIAKTFLGSSEFQNTLKGIINSDITRGLAAFSKYADSVNWDEERIKEVFEECYYDEVALTEPKGQDKKSDNGYLMQKVFIILAAITSLDFSNLRDEKKRNIFLAQLMHLAVSYSGVLDISNQEKISFDKERIIKTSCLAREGCVIRKGPGKEFDKITAIPKGFVSKRLGIKDAWSRVEYYSLKTGVSEGWIQSDILSD